MRIGSVREFGRHVFWCGFFGGQAVICGFAAIATLDIIPIALTTAAAAMSIWHGSRANAEFAKCG
jgi:hypothetical protein